MTAHPYYPTTLSIPHYVPPSRSTFAMLSQFFVFVVVILAASFWIISRQKPHSFTTKLVFVWFVACGFIHSVIEGYYITNYKEIAGQTTLLADCWKEYSYSDSRYMSADTFIFTMETVTTITWGPLSFLTAYFILKAHPAQFVLSFLVSTGQLYGTILYFFTSLIEGAPECSPSPFHFWGYFVGFNAPWVIMPLLIMYGAAREITRCIGIVHRQLNGAPKKRN